MIRGRIGVEIDQVTKEVAESIGLGKPHGRAGAQRRSRRRRPRRRASRRATSSPRSTAAPSTSAGDLPRIVGNIKPGTQGDAAGVPPRRLRATCSVTVAEFEPEKPAPPQPPSAKRRQAAAAGRAATRPGRARPHRRAEARAEDQGRRAGRERSKARRPGPASARATSILAIDNVEVTRRQAVRAGGRQGRQDASRSRVLVRRGESRQLPGHPAGALTARVATSSGARLARGRGILTAVDRSESTAERLLRRIAVRECRNASQRQSAFIEGPTRMRACLRAMAGRSSALNGSRAAPQRSARLWISCG